VLGAVVYFTRSEDAIAVDSGLSEAIGKAVTEAPERGEDVDLAAITSFPWDEVYIFPPRTPRKRVSSVVGFEFKGDLPYDAESTEVFVFTDNGTFARFADYRGRAVWTGLRRPIAVLSARQAVFRVRDGVVRPR
jgi:hypothetical protein